MKRTLGLLPLLAWLASILIAFVGPILRPKIPTTTLLPRVSINTTHTDLSSSVEALLIVVVWSVLCCLLVEPSKFFSHSATSRGSLVYSCLVLFQATLVAETVRVNLDDWWFWCLSALGIGQHPDLLDPPNVTRNHFPWLSLSLSLLLALMWWKMSREGTSRRAP